MDLSQSKNSLQKIPANRIMALMVLLVISLFCFPGCEKAEKIPELTTPDKILKADEITVITRNDAHCYYMYRGQPMGFEYDLAKAFADFLGAKLKVKIVENWDGMISALMDGSGALIAANLTITPKRQNKVAFSDGYMTIQQYIIVHRNNLSIKRAEDLAGKTIHVRKGTSYEERLEALKKEEIDLRIKPIEDLTTEELIRQVAEKNIEITIANSNVALLNRRYYPDAIVAAPVTEKEDLCWAVNPNAYKFLDRINLFFKTIKKNGKLEEIYNRYYTDIDDFDYFDLRTYHRRLKTRLPKYSRIIKESATIHNLDWRLIAAQMYQESHFDPRAKSYAGAHGLMQLTYPIARSLGVEDILNPTQNINAGVQHLKKLFDFFDKANGLDRLYIALAAYNIGQGHIQDARNLAIKMNLDPNKWSSLSKTLPLLTYRKYNTNALYGYCRGKEPIKYVKQIMIYYDILKRQGIEYITVAQSEQEGV